MPTYEYSCQKCGQNFEAFQSMRDEPFRECPKELCDIEIHEIGVMEND